MNVLVIGGGPAGMTAAYAAAENGHAVILIERNEKLGKKLYLTGKGRCNVTNTAGRDEFFQNVFRNARFLYGALSRFDHDDIAALLTSTGLALKTERGGRVFPASDKSSDVLRAFDALLTRAGVTVRLNTRALGVLTEGGAVTGVETDAGAFPAGAVVVATGGLSYPSTGSTGDGYRFAETCGHTIAKPAPSLVPFETAESWPYPLAGLTLKNVKLTVERNGKRVFSELGELLLTHFGVSGPLVLSASAAVADAPEGARLLIDFKPALSDAALDARLLRDLAESARKQVGTALHALLPQRLLLTVLELANIDAAAPVGELTREQRKKLVETLKAAPLTVRRTRPIEEAIVTRGGVNVGEINSSTMESKLTRGLYFAGEVIDVDALTGGFNLQIAYSTGAAAGRSI